MKSRRPRMKSPPGMPELLVGLHGNKPPAFLGATQTIPIQAPGEGSPFIAEQTGSGIVPEIQGIRQGEYVKSLIIRQDGNQQGDLADRIPYDPLVYQFIPIISLTAAIEIDADHPGLEFQEPLSLFSKLP
jgi:hypothetical protein